MGELIKTSWYDKVDTHPQTHSNRKVFTLRAINTSISSVTLTQTLWWAVKHRDRRVTAQELQSVAQNFTLWWWKRTISVKNLSRTDSELTEGWWRKESRVRERTQKYPNIKLDTLNLISNQRAVLKGKSNSCSGCVSSSISRFDWH